LQAPSPQLRPAVVLIGIPRDVEAAAGGSDGDAGDDFAAAA
jgi:hypothetical protein